MLFSQIQQAPGQNLGGWENPYTASSARHQRSADVMKAQCERHESILRAQRIANENSVGTQ